MFDNPTIAKKKKNILRLLKEKNNFFFLIPSDPCPCKNYEKLEKN